MSGVVPSTTDTMDQVIERTQTLLERGSPVYPSDIRALIHLARQAQAALVGIDHYNDLAGPTDMNDIMGLLQGLRQTLERNKP